jgi:hypothetical protein
MMGFGVGFALTPMNLAAMNAISRDHAGAASGLLVTLSGLGASLGVAVTGAIFQQLQIDRTTALSAQHGVSLTAAQSHMLDGLLAGSPGSMTTLHQVAGAKAPEIHEAVRQAFVSALGSSLKLSAALIVAGLVLALLIMRRQAPADADVPHPVIAPPTRPAPRVAAG